MPGVRLQKQRTARRKVIRAFRGYSADKGEAVFSAVKGKARFMPYFRRQGGDDRRGYVGRV